MYQLHLQKFNRLIVQSVKLSKIRGQDLREAMGTFSVQERVRLPWNILDGTMSQL